MHPFWKGLLDGLDTPVVMFPDWAAEDIEELGISDLKIIKPQQYGTPNHGNKEWLLFKTSLGLLVACNLKKKLV